MDPEIVVLLVVIGIFALLLLGGCAGAMYPAKSPLIRFGSLFHTTGTKGELEGRIKDLREAVRLVCKTDAQLEQALQHGSETTEQPRKAENRSLSAQLTGKPVANQVKTVSERLQDRRQDAARLAASANNDLKNAKIALADLEASKNALRNKVSNENDKNMPNRTSLQQWALDAARLDKQIAGAEIAVQAARRQVDVLATQADRNRDADEQAVNKATTTAVAKGVKMKVSKSQYDYWVAALEAQTKELESANTALANAVGPNAKDAASRRTTDAKKGIAYYADKVATSEPLAPTSASGAIGAYGRVR